MEGGRNDGDGGVARAAAAAGLELELERRRWRGAGGGGGGVELSLRLRTGAADDDDGGGADASAPPAVGAALAPEARRRNMTIFYNGRVCAVDVTEVQARAIISMASEETTLAADHRRRQHQVMRRDDGDGRYQDRDTRDSSSSSSSTSAVARRCTRELGFVRPAAAVAMAPLSMAAAGGVVSPRQGGFAGGAVAVPLVEIDPAAATAGLSMKRSLQLFLQKRKARTAAAVAPPYAGGGRQAQAVRR